MDGYLLPGSTNVLTTISKETELREVADLGTPIFEALQEILATWEPTIQ